MQSRALAADLVATGGFNRLMLIDAHTPAIEGFFNVPVDHLTAEPLLAEAAKPFVDGASVLVAPDLGASRWQVNVLVCCRRRSHSSTTPA